MNGGKTQAFHYFFLNPSEKQSGWALTGFRLPSNGCHFLSSRAISLILTSNNRPVDVAVYIGFAGLWFNIFRSTHFKFLSSNIVIIIFMSPHLRDSIPVMVNYVFTHLQVCTESSLRESDSHLSGFIFEV